MTKDDFIPIYFEQEKAIELIAQKAGALHKSVNQNYGGYLPYEFHLRLTASYVTRFAHLTDIKGEDLQTIYAAAYYHDSMEDARLTYHDVQKAFRELNEEGCHIHVDEAAEIVYALTNEKGRTREERADDKYYEGIRNTKYASFLKMCDRLANIRYSTLMGIQQRMAVIYAGEMPHFLQSIGHVPTEMAEEAEKMLREGYQRPY